MNARKYLSQVYGLDTRINSKLEQAARLRALAQKTTTTFTTVRVKEPVRHSKMEDCVVRLVDLENEINRDIDQLVDLKRDVQHKIDSIENTDHKLLLELRYLNFKTWEQIAEEMHYSPESISWLHKLHRKALLKLDMERHR